MPKKVAKRPGRPAKREGERAKPVSASLPPELFVALVAYERRHGLTRSQAIAEAVRRMVGGQLAHTSAIAVRVLVPRVHRRIIEEMRSGKHCVLSRGPEMGLADAVEIMWDDGTDDPFALHLSPESLHRKGLHQIKTD